MNVDTQFAHTPTTTAPERPVQAAAEQVSSRPAERPARDEAAGNQTGQGESTRNESMPQARSADIPANQSTTGEPGDLLDVIV